MIFELKKSHSLITNEKVLGVENENRSEIITINIEDEALWDKWAYIEFWLDDETEFLTPRLEIVDGQINYIMPNSLMKGGYLKIQAVFRDYSEWVWKSFVKQVIVRKSLNVDGDVAEENPDFITNAQRILDECERAAVDVENKVDKTTKINNYTLESDVNLEADDIGAYSKDDVDDILDGLNISNAEIDAIFNT